MNITVINGTNRKGNLSIQISREVKKSARKKKHGASLITLNNFTRLFDGEYITAENATTPQLKDIKSLLTGDIFVFVVPVYHNAMPAALKNFTEIIDEDGIWEHRVIGFISVNAHGHVFGAEHAQDAINGILSYKQAHSFVAPRITTINQYEIDKKRIADYIDHLVQYTKFHPWSITP